MIPHRKKLLSSMIFMAVAGSQTVLAQPTEVEEITVLGRQEFLETEFTARRDGANVDSAKLMGQVPGGGANNNGPLTGQIQYRGMFGPRVDVRVDGMLIHGGGPNWMAPPLHHIPAPLMEELVVQQGISSVSAGNGIGGAVNGLWKRPAFGSDGNWAFTGDTEFGLSSVDEGTSAAGIIGVSNNNHRIYVVGNIDEGDDYDTPRGEVAATQYERLVTGVGYGYNDGTNEFEIDFHKIETDDTGTPSLPMDIDWFDTETWNAMYRGQFGAIGLEARVYGSEIDHGMSNYLLRTAPDFSSLMLPPFLGDDKRNVRTDSDEFGYKLAIDFALGEGSAVVGIEGKDAEHNATVFDPDFAPFFVENFNDIDVESTSFFAEWSALFNNTWYVELGARFEQVDMSAGNVGAFPASLVDMNPAMWPMGTPPRAVWMLREGFNAADRNLDDDNDNYVAKVRYQATDALVIEAGYAHRVRSPLYQERFLWIPLEANAGLGDGNNYVGNLALQPEESDQFELGFDFNWGSAYFSPRFYVRDVDDYIQGVPATNMAVIGVSANANGDPTPLMFANTDAKFRGVDITFGFELANNWTVDGIASTVRGERDDIDDNLYRVNPNTLRLAVNYDGGDFTVKIEQVMVDDQNRISQTNTNDPANGNNNSDPTPGYSITNAYLDWFIDENLSLTLGVENLLDDDYVDHLTGFNRVLNSVVPRGTRMVGPGQNFFGRLQWRW